MCVQIAAKKGRPSTSQLITGVPPVTATTGALESDQLGVLPADLHWSLTRVVSLRGTSGVGDRRDT